MEPQQSITSPDCIEVSMPDQVPDTTMRTGTGKAIQDLSHIITDIIAEATVTPIEVILHHDIWIITIITGVVHDAPIPHTGVMAINLAMTHARTCIH